MARDIRPALFASRASARAEPRPTALASQPSRLLKNVLHSSYKRWVFEKTELEKQGKFWHPENGTSYGLEGGFFGSSWPCSLQQSHLDPPTQVRFVLYPFSRFFYSPLRLQTLRTLVFQQSARLKSVNRFAAKVQRTPRRLLKNALHFGYK